ncbi:MAG: hypothetical protein ACREFP_24815 [Acetobacteraceae bacterium]
MRTSVISGLGALALLLAAVPASAAEQPPLTPTRDVAVTYQATNAKGTVHVVHMSFDAPGRRLHIDVVGEPVFQVIDRKANVAVLVLDTKKVYLERPLPPDMGNIMDRSPNMIMKKGATAKVAGLSCTLWSVPTGPNSPDLEACITEDGVLLKAGPANRASNQPRLEATSVVYGPQPEQLFVPPAGFHRIEPTPPPGAPGAQPPAQSAPAQPPAAKP